MSRDTFNKTLKEVDSNVFGRKKLYVIARRDMYGEILFLQKTSKGKPNYGNAPFSWSYGFAHVFVGSEPDLSSLCKIKKKSLSYDGQIWEVDRIGTTKIDYTLSQSKDVFIIRLNSSGASAELVTVGDYLLEDLPGNYKTVQTLEDIEKNGNKKHPKK